MLYGAESCTQATMFISYVSKLLPLRMILYANACGVRRFIKTRVGEFQGRGERVPKQWLALSALTWVIDRLHFGYHRG